MNTYLSLPQSQATELSKIKRKLPASSYWAIAQEIIKNTGIRTGNCLEINSNNCFFGIAMAQLTDLQIYLMDNSERLSKHIDFHLKQKYVANRVQFIKGTPQQIPVADHNINLVIYRKSIFAWHSQVKVFQEIYRVLAPGGMVYIWDNSWDGGNWISIENKLKEYRPKLTGQLNGDIWRQRLEGIRKNIIQADITSFEMDCDDGGLRIIIRRPIGQEKVS